ncbi:MAG TPA: dihydrofolate reductase [Chloroflexota bacterium]|nr:dihydrofolate reductase [Chloroflexota bacterium]HUM68869.1 dihydrofolate reductase [Chloroflexota bacterium]
MIVSLIVAMDHNRLIGANNGLPWRLPDDMGWFVEQTMGKPVIMGRKTYDSIPARFKPLHGRHNIIITRNRHYHAEGCTVVHSFPAALAAAAEPPEVMIGGGAQIYAEALPLAHRLYLTLIDGEFSGDSYFPPFDPAEWREIFRQVHEPDTRHAHRFTWLIWSRP